MKNNKYIILCLSVMLVLLLALTACGGSKITETQPEGTTIGAPATEAPTDAPIPKVEVTLYIQDQDGNPIPDAVITILPADETSESATLTANGEGGITVNLPEGEYTVRFDVLPEYVLGFDTSITVVSDMKPVTLTVTDNTPNGSEERPFVIREDTVTVTVPTGETYHFTLFGGNNRTLTLENANAEIIYKDTTYIPDASGMIEVRMSTDNPRDPSFFALTNKGAEACEMTVVILSDPGAMDNPIVVERLNEAITANVPQDGMVYYKWIATATGTLTVTSADVINNISLNNLTTSQVSNFTEGGESETLTVTEGDEITVVVSAIGGNNSAEYNTVTFTLTMGE